MGHSEITQAPGQGGNDGYGRIGSGSPGRNVIALGKAQVAGKTLGILHYRIPASRGMDTKNHNNNKRQCHNHRLHQIRNGCRQEAAQGRISHNHAGRENHRRKIIHAKQAGEQCSAGIEAGGSIRNKENNDDDCGSKG